MTPQSVWCFHLLGSKQALRDSLLCSAFTQGDRSVASGDQVNVTYTCLPQMMVRKEVKGEVMKSEPQNIEQGCPMMKYFLGAYPICSALCGRISQTSFGRFLAGIQCF